MKKYILLLLTAVTIVCNKPAPTGDFDRIFAGLSSANSFKDTEKYYSMETIKAVNRAWKKGLVKRNNRQSLLPLFNKYTRLELKNKKINDKKATVKIRYLDHPVENMIGSEIVIRLVLENGGWKIDLEDEINEISGRINSKGSKDYLIK